MIFSILSTNIVDTDACSYLWISLSISFSYSLFGPSLSCSSFLYYSIWACFLSLDCFLSLSYFLYESYSFLGLPLVDFLILISSLMLSLMSDFSSSISSLMALSSYLFLELENCYSSYSSYIDSLSTLDYSFLRDCDFMISSDILDWYENTLF